VALEHYWMKKNATETLIFIASLLLMGVLGAFYSLIFAGVVGWAALGAAPEASFRMLDKVICPAGASMEYIPGRSGSSYQVKCHLIDGSEQDTKSQAVQAVFGSFFLVCFIPTFIPGAILMWFSIRRWSQRYSSAEIRPPESDDR
jgi:hypothetical protein